MNVDLISVCSVLLLSTVLILSSLSLSSGLVTPVLGQEQEEIEPIPPVNITNQTTSQVSKQIEDMPILN